MPEAMSISVKPIHLKTAAKVSGSVKDVTPLAGKKLYWNSVHRLVAVNNKLTLYTNDGALWLEWVVPVEGSFTEEFDIIVPAALFNEMASKSAEGALYDIDHSGGILHLTQGQRNLRLKEESNSEYPLPQSPEESVNHTWTIKTEPFMKGLKFVTPFIDAVNPTASKSVASLTTQGTMAGGSPRRLARVSNLTAPPVGISFKQKTAKSVVAFLSSLGDDVKITVDSSHYTFECPLSGHKLIVSAEAAMFPQTFQNLEGKEDEILKIDNKTITSGVSILSTLLPTDTDRLNVRIKGLGSNASIRLSTLGDDNKNSNDEFPILRTVMVRGEDGVPAPLEPGGPLPSDTFIAANVRVLQEALSQMDGVTLEARYYTRMRLLYIEDEKTGDLEIVRSIILNVQNITSEDEPAPDIETPAPVSTPTPEPEPALATSAATPVSAISGVSEQEE
jgi:DNA polymerase III sliding clamp (beta) subunit (PCNA family)